LDTMNDKELIIRYRFDRERINNICEIATERLQRFKSDGLPVSLRVLAALRWYATGTTLTTIGDLHSMSRFSCSNAVHDLSAILTDVKNRYVTFPRDPDLQQEMMQTFYDMAGMPRCIGAVDGTLIPIVAPNDEDEYAYVCRKGYHAINTQGVWDAHVTPVAFPLKACALP